MKRSYIRKWLTVCICLVLFSSIRQQASAQSVARDFHAPQYQEAIGNIAKTSNGELTPVAIISILSGGRPDDHSTPADRSTEDGEFITVDPVIDVVSFNGEEHAGFTVNSFPTGSTLDTINVAFSPSKPAWIDGDPIISIVGDMGTITINVEENTSEDARSTGIIINATVGGDTVPSVAAYIIQEGNPGSIILVSPEMQALSYQEQTTDKFHITHFNISDWEVGSTLPEWIDIGENSHTGTDQYIKFEITQNTSDELRNAAITIQEVDNPDVSDVLTIYQGTQSVSTILVTPEIQTISYLGGETEDFTIINFNIDGWEVVDPDGLPYGITIADGYPSGDLIAFSVPPNDGDTYREADIIIQEIGDGVSDILTIFQGAESPQPFIYIDPEIQSISYLGGETEDFTIINFNIDGWEVDISTLPDWIPEDEIIITGDIIVFNVSENAEDTYRTDIIKIQEVDDPTVFDELTIVQGALSESSILITPEIQSFSYAAQTTAQFNIIHFNIIDWELAPGTLPDWISGYTADHDANSITFDIQLNEDDTYREDTIFIREIDNPAVSDILTIYQGALSDTSILVTPEVQSVPYSGGLTEPFYIIHFNIGEWEVDPATLPDWISVADSVQTDDHTGNYITFSLDTNELDVYRVDTIVIRETGNPAVFDILTIYQGALSESVILITPEIQSVTYEAQTTDTFNIIHFNIENWEVDPATIPDWISIADSSQSDDHTGNYITFGIETNELDTYRDTTIRIREVGNPSIFDVLTIYQGALSESVILLTPEIQAITYEAQTTAQFDVIHFNIEDWEVVENTVPEWVSSYYDDHVEDFVTFDVELNEDDTYREHTVTIQEVGNPGVFDQLKIIQGALSVSSILITPEVQGITYEAQTTGEYDIIHFNIDGWELVESTIPDWVASYYDDHVEDFVTFNVELNEDDTYREHTVTIQEEGNPGVFNQLRIVQGALAVSTLLIYPEIQALTFEAQTTAQYHIINFNIEDWEVVESTLPDWISGYFDDHDEDFITFNVDLNPGHTYRQDTITIQEIGNPGISDQLVILQDAHPQSYILTAPREIVFPWNYPSDTLNKFTITPVNVSVLDFEIIFDPPGLNEWLSDTAIVNNEFIFRIAGENDTNITRVGGIRIFDQLNPLVDDTVYIYQRSSFDPYIILIPASQDSISHAGEIFQIDTYSNLEEYAVNVDAQGNWVHLSDDTLSYDDAVEITVDQNTDAFQSRSAIITFHHITDSTVFYLHQLKAPPEYVTLSGYVNETGSGLEGVIIYADPDSVITGPNGHYEIDVLKNWQGTVIPKSQTYYFDPPQIVIDKIGGVDQDTSDINFNAYLIDPKVTISLSGSSICIGESLDGSQSGEYPVLLIQGTYGPEVYRWSTVPSGSENTISDTTILDPVFTPISTTTYVFKLINNSDTIESGTFTITVKPLPEARYYSGEFTVCRNQAGMVYSVGEFNDSDYFEWDLPQGGGSFVTDPNTNIAVINWGSDPGTYELSLTTFQDGCNADPFVVNITIPEDASSPSPAGVYRKSEDNFLYCDDPDADEYKWGWFRQVDSRIVGGPVYIPDKNEWYCRLPDGYSADSDTNRYFVEIRYNGMECFSRSFYNAPVFLDEMGPQHIVVFPNPAENVIYVRFNDLGASSNATLKIHDFIGHLVYNKALHGMLNNTTFTVNEARYFKSGIYLMSIQVEDLLYKTKIIIR